MSLDDRSLVLTRTFRAPPQVVYDAWINPQTLPLWFAPEGLRCVSHDIDLREGGHWLFDMVGDGVTFANRHRFTRLVPGERIEFLMDDGQDDGVPFEVTAILTPHEGGTLLTYTMVLPTPEAKQQALSYNAVELGYTTFAKLAAVLGE